MFLMLNLTSLQLEDVHNEQSDADFYILHELIKDYLSLLGVVKVRWETEYFAYFRI